jgi:hypothetical protein
VRVAAEPGTASTPSTSRRMSLVIGLFLGSPV